MAKLLCHQKPIGGNAQAGVVVEPAPAGMGVTLVPRLSVPRDALLTVSRRRKSDETYIRYLPIREEDGGPPPTRRVVLAWRRSFTRYEAIAALRNAIYACELPGVTRLS
jgi:LysR family hydrogen peroxide-inducible transcriptional activator